MWCTRCGGACSAGWSGDAAAAAPAAERRAATVALPTAPPPPIAGATGAEGASIESDSDTGIGIGIGLGVGVGVEPIGVGVGRIPPAEAGDGDDVTALAAGDLAAGASGVTGVEVAAGAGAAGVGTMRAGCGCDCDCDGFDCGCACSVLGTVWSRFRLLAFLWSLRALVSAVGCEGLGDAACVDGDGDEGEGGCCCTAGEVGAAEAVDGAAVCRLLACRVSARLEEADVDAAEAAAAAAAWPRPLATFCVGAAALVGGCVGGAVAESGEERGACEAGRVVCCRCVRCGWCCCCDWLDVGAAGVGAGAGAGAGESRCLVSRLRAAPRCGLDDGEALEGALTAGAGAAAGDGAGDGSFACDLAVLGGLVVGAERGAGELVVVGAADGGAVLEPFGLGSRLPRLPALGWVGD